MFTTRKHNLVRCRRTERIAQPRPINIIVGPSHVVLNDVSLKDAVPHHLPVVGAIRLIHISNPMNLSGFAVSTDTIDLLYYLVLEGSCLFSKPLSSIFLNCKRLLNSSLFRNVPGLDNLPIHKDIPYVSLISIDTQGRIRWA